MVVLLSSCKANETTLTPLVIESSPELSETVPATQISTPTQPAPTPVPLVVSVNGEGITVVEYQDELVRFQAAVGRELTSEDEERVLDDLISQLLLAQAAAENGYKMTETVLQDRLDQLIDGMGGKAVFDDWLVSNNYVEDSFRGALSRSISAAWMRDQIAASVPVAMDQVHAQQILVFDAQEANLILGRIQAGADFSALAFEYDPIARGDLGWFPRGYLLEPRVEDAAFELQPGQHSKVIETQTGYHIVFIIEKDPARALDPDARLALQTTALQEWLERRKAESDIQIR